MYIYVSPKLLKSFSMVLYLQVVTNQNYFIEEVNVCSRTTVKLQRKISAQTIVRLYQSARHHILSQVNHLYWKKNFWLVFPLDI